MFEALLIYLHPPLGVVHPLHHVYILVTAVLQYIGITTLQIRHYVERCYHIGLTFQKLRKDAMPENSSNNSIAIGQLLHTLEGLSLIQSTLINYLCRDLNI